MSTYADLDFYRDLTTYYHLSTPAVVATPGVAVGTVTTSDVTVTTFVDTPGEGDPGVAVAAGVASDVTVSTYSAAPVMSNVAVAVGEASNVTVVVGHGVKQFVTPIRDQHPVSRPVFRPLEYYPGNSVTQFWDREAWIQVHANVFLLTDGTVTEIQPNDWDVVARMFQGGVSELSPAEEAILVAAGYGANIT